MCKHISHVLIPNYAQKQEQHYKPRIYEFTDYVLLAITLTGCDVTWHVGAVPDALVVAPTCHAPVSVTVYTVVVGDTRVAFAALRLHVVFTLARHLVRAQARAGRVTRACCAAVCCVRAKVCRVELALIARVSLHVLFTRADSTHLVKRSKIMTAIMLASK